MTAPKNATVTLTWKSGTHGLDYGSATQDASLSATNLRVDGALVTITRKTDTEPVYRFSSAQLAAIGAMSDAAFGRAISTGKLTIPAKATRGRPSKVRTSDASGFRARYAPTAPAPKRTRAPKSAPATAPADESPSV